MEKEENAIMLVNCVVNIVLAFTVTIGNVVVLYAVWKKPTLRSPSILLLCGLASTDLAVGLIAQPLFIASSLMILYTRSETLILTFEKVYDAISFPVCGVSLCIIAGLSLDRLTAILKPLQYPSIVTVRRVTCILLAIWTFCVFAGTIQLWEKRIQLAGVASVILIGFFISVICHTTIFVIVRRHRREIQIQARAFEGADATASMASFRKSTFSTFIFFIVLVICYFPYLLVCIIYFARERREALLGRSLATTVVFMNSALNPFLYGWRVPELRNAMLQVFRAKEVRSTNSVV
ncbi:adrenocorticotropic hormone receptor-like [Montipora foliosa]|uniref:adrenocorticotropic hormone receptor-like n=1 Tax=Montipora foliosa TaxID=591990 RepID=UPI0035F1F8B9